MFVSLCFLFCFSKIGSIMLIFIFFFSVGNFEMLKKLVDVLHLKGCRMGRSDKVSLWYVSLLINTRFRFLYFRISNC